MNRLAISLTAALAFALGGCGTSPDTGTTNSTNTMDNTDKTSMEKTAQPLKVDTVPMTETSKPTTGHGMKNLIYPQSKQLDVVDDYNGVKVADPYRWLENLDSEETRDWVKRQVAFTEDYFKNVPEREQFRQQLKAIWDYERVSAPEKVGQQYAYWKNDGLQNQAVLYVTDDLNQEGRVLIDPNTLSEDQTASVAGVEFSPKGRYMAYGISEGGSDWRTWKVRDVATGKDTDDELHWVKFSAPAWLPDESGFFYARYDEPKDENELKAVNYNQKVYFHKLGTDQSQDTLIYQRPDHKEWGFGNIVTEDGRFLLLPVWKGTDERNLILFKRLGSDEPFKPLTPEFENSYQFIGNQGDDLYFVTDENADNYRIIKINAKAPQQHVEIVPNNPKATLRSASLVGNKLLVSYLDNAYSKVKRFDLNGNDLGEVTLPGIGSVSGFSGKQNDTETFYTFNNFYTPTTVYRYDVEKNQSQLLKQPKVAFNPDDYTTEQVWYTSKDGTRVPMFISYKKGLKKDGNNPTLLYGYGGFNIPITPRFSPANIVWMNNGGVYAVANLRGGGEFGKAWHEAGTKTRKQNVFDDFIAAAEYLIREKYTNPKKLAINGRSNGGLLAAATVMQRPDLFAASVPEVGVQDMLRFNKFTIGWAWESDYGSPQNPEEFAALRAYSPVHNAVEKEYPAIMITTADHDDRVFPAHSFKLAAALQNAQKGDQPIVIRIDTKAGHGAGKPTDKVIDEVADRFAFMRHNMSDDTKDNTKE